MTNEPTNNSQSTPELEVLQSLEGVFVGIQEKLSSLDKSQQMIIKVLPKATDSQGNTVLQRLVGERNLHSLQTNITTEVLKAEGRIDELVNIVKRQEKSIEEVRSNIQVLRTLVEELKSAAPNNRAEATEPRAKAQPNRVTSNIPPAVAGSTQLSQSSAESRAKTTPHTSATAEISAPPKKQSGELTNLLASQATVVSVTEQQESIKQQWQSEIIQKLVKSSGYGNCGDLKPRIDALFDEYEKNKSDNSNTSHRHAEHLWVILLSKLNIGKYHYKINTKGAANFAKMLASKQHNELLNQWGISNGLVTKDSIHKILIGTKFGGQKDPNIDTFWIKTSVTASDFQDFCEAYQKQEGATK